MRQRPWNPGARRRAAAVLPAALAAVLLAGCGSSSPSGSGIASKTPEQVVAAARSRRAGCRDSAHVRLNAERRKADSPGYGTGCRQGREGEDRRGRLGVDLDCRRTSGVRQRQHRALQEHRGTRGGAGAGGQVAEGAAEVAQLRPAELPCQHRRPRRHDAHGPRGPREGTGEHRRRRAGGRRDGPLQGRARSTSQRPGSHTRWRSSNRQAAPAGSSSTAGTSP